jgi:hypothetical protein
MTAICLARARSAVHSNQPTSANTSEPCLQPITTTRGNIGGHRPDRTRLPLNARFTESGDYRERARSSHLLRALGAQPQGRRSTCQRLCAASADADGWVKARAAQARFIVEIPVFNSAGTAGLPLEPRARSS